MTDLKKPDLSKDTTVERVVFARVLRDDQGHACSATFWSTPERARRLGPCAAVLQLEVDDQGVPVDGSVVRRVEP